jgi:hypothetical protein
MGDDLVREKLMENPAGTRDEILWEAADLLRFAAALMTCAGFTGQVWTIYKVFCILAT